MDLEKNTHISTELSAISVREETIIANSFTIEGDIVAKEDTLIEGRVEGSILAEEHTVHIGKQGYVSGEIFAKRIIAEGRIKGHLNAKETLVLRQSADVQGEILAPQVAMEEGCKFNGRIKMDVAATSAALARGRKLMTAALLDKGQTVKQE